MSSVATRPDIWSKGKPSGSCELQIQVEVEGIEPSRAVEIIIYIRLNAISNNFVADVFGTAILPLDDTSINFTLSFHKF